MKKLLAFFGFKFRFCFDLESPTYQIPTRYQLLHRFTGSIIWYQSPIEWIDWRDLEGRIKQNIKPLI